MSKNRIIYRRNAPGGIDNLIGDAVKASEKQQSNYNNILNQPGPFLSITDIGPQLNQKKEKVRNVNDHMNDTNGLYLVNMENSTNTLNNFIEPSRSTVLSIPSSTFTQYAPPSPPPVPEIISTEYVQLNDPTVLNIPSNLELDQFLKSNTEQSKLCSFIMTGVSALIDDKLNSFREEFKQWQDNVSQQIEFVGNVTWGCENEIKSLREEIVNKIAGKFHSMPAALTTSNPVREGPELITFPLESVEQVQEFETVLQDECKSKLYLDFLSSKLEQRSGKSIYSRRRWTKDIMFSEYVFKSLSMINIPNILI